MHANILTAASALLPLLLTLPAHASTIASPVIRNATTTATGDITCGAGTSAIGICVDYSTCGVWYGGCTSYCAGDPIPQYTPPPSLSEVCKTWVEPRTTTIIPHVPGPSGSPGTSGWPTVSTNATTWTTTKPTPTPKPDDGGDNGENGGDNEESGGDNEEKPPADSFGARFEVGVMMVVPAVVAGVLGYLL